MPKRTIPDVRRMTSSSTRTPRRLAAAAARLSVAALVAALLFEHVGGLHPCELCIDQRWSHVGVAAAALALLARPTRLSGLVLLLSSMNAFGQAVRHVGVEQGLWGSACAAPQGNSGLTPEAFLQAILEAPVVRCDEIAWAFAGLSMAGWNAVLCVGLVLLSGLALARTPSAPARKDRR
jgi:disulfide bond formation protein DsbB